MGQETDTWQSERNLEREQTHDRKKDESATGRDMPGGDGTVGDTEVKAITGDDRRGKPTGQDHSTEHHERTDPDHGVGEFQRSSDTTSDNVHIDDNS
jgi:hypothetical protein